MRRVVVGLALWFAGQAAAEWKPAPAKLMTRWGKEIAAATVPWSEHPRPQMQRNDWRCLNGLWDYAIVPRNAPRPAKWDGQIMAPFCPESALSGVGKEVGIDKHLWYRRTVDIPAEWAGQRLLLHFDAVDWEATVFVNGKEVGVHRGGFDPFAFDIADFVADGKAEVAVRVWDPTDQGSQPVGKQISNPHGIWYTPVTGIWQTAWMEPVHPAHVTSVRFQADLKKGEVEALVEVEGTAETVNILLPQPGTNVLKLAGSGKPGTPIRFKPLSAERWTPDTPTLHTAFVQAVRRIPEGNETDSVATYFALREISTGKDAKGVLRLLLNGEPLFHLGPLDQGWWPDGLLTPPSDAAMKYDLEILKKLGMNMLRKHIKVEPSRLYYHCDRLGLMVWQDMPSCINRTKQHFVRPEAREDAVFTADEHAVYMRELKAMMDHLRFFPCIVSWVPFNEGWGQHQTNEVLKWTKAYDPARLVDGPSGWADRGFGDMKDLHQYRGPGMFPAMPDRVSVLGEFGGLGLPIKGHLWRETSDNWGYGGALKDIPELRETYGQLIRRLPPLVGKGLSAAVYTQTTDVEVEVNGFMTYDREILKLDPVETAAWHRKVFGPSPVEQILLAPSAETGAQWRHTTAKPAAGWEQPGFDAGRWPEGPGGFGTHGTPNAKIGTVWNTGDVWLRRAVTLPAAPVGELAIRIHHDEDAEVYLNGVLAAKVAGYNNRYEDVPVLPAAAKALKAGPNAIAVHCRQTTGGQFIDVGLLEYVPAKP